MSLILDLCDALAAALNAHSFSTTFTAVVEVAPEMMLEDLNELHVVVDPFSGQAGLMSDTRDSHERILAPDITIAIRKQVLQTESIRTTFQPEFDLVDEIVDFLLDEPNRRLGPNGEYCQTGEINNEPIYVEPHMRERNQFTSEIQPRYRTVR